MDSTFHYSEWIGQCFRIKAQQKLSQRSFLQFCFRKAPKRSVSRAYLRSYIM